MKKLLFRFCMSAILLAGSGCSSVRVQTAAAGGTAEGAVKLHKLGWKLANTMYVVPNSLCDNQKLYSVEMRSNFLQTVTSIITLGIYHPLTIKWTCATPCERCQPCP